MDGERVVERVLMEAAEAVDSATPSPTSLLQNPSGFAQLPQDAVQQHPGTGGEISLPEGITEPTLVNGIMFYPGNPEHIERMLAGIERFYTVEIPVNVFTGFPSDLWTFIRKEVYQMTREAGLCWQCRRPTGGPTLCKEHRVKASKNQVKSARRKKREAREKKLRKKLGTTENVVDALDTFLAVRSSVKRNQK